MTFLDLLNQMPRGTVFTDINESIAVLIYQCPRGQGDHVTGRVTLDQVWAICTRLQLMMQ